jgi:hypothetical protein
MGAIGGTGEVEQADALTLLDAALSKSPNDFSVALIRSLVQGQKAQAKGPNSWCDVYKTVTGVTAGFPDRPNMRSQAIQVIMKYITIYKDYCAPPKKR